MENQFICLKNDNIEVLLTPIGASIRSLFVKDCEGEWRDVVLGYESEEEYLTNPASLGAVVGRYAGRISNAGFSLGDKHYSLDKNDGNNCLHGGFNRYETRVFRVISNLNHPKCFIPSDDQGENETFHHDNKTFHHDNLASYSDDKIHVENDVSSDNKVIFELRSPSGDQGFPGNALIRVTYTLEGSDLRVDYYCETDEETVFNLTNHSYFQLERPKKSDLKDVDNHILSLKSDSYIVFDEEGIPTGELKNVEGTKYDLRRPKKLSEVYDNCFIMNSGEGEADASMRGHISKEDSWNPCATLYSPESGIKMDVITDRPVMVVYTSEFLNVERGKNGCSYKKRQAVCLETEGYPDAMNRPEFPLEIYDKNKPFSSFTIFRFGVED